MSATSPRLALPARSPIPLIVPWTQRRARRGRRRRRSRSRGRSRCGRGSGPGRPADPADGPADELGDRLGRGDPERVDDDDLLRAGLDRRRVDLLVEVEVGARRVDAEERGVDPVLGGEAHRVGDPLEHLLAGDADRVELEVGDRRLDHRGARRRARRAPRGRPGPRARSPRSRRAGRRRRSARRRASRRPRRAGSPPRSGRSRARRAPRDLELLLGVEHDADRLLAVAERRVVEADRPPSRNGSLSAPVQIRSLIGSRRGSGRASRARPR